ncbi:hypothetical protein PWT90_10272 [Aphanocladium album]|nr:hypothetical protein PWT90_10272 [Aphanocladium album]
MASNPTEVVTPTITTPRATLRPYRADDEQVFQALFQDEQVNHFVLYRKSATPEMIQALFQRILHDVYAERRFAVWAVECDGQFAGHAEIKPSRADDIDGWEIVYMLAKAHWGKGLATEIAERISEYGFKELGLDEIYATIYMDNKASKAVATKLGYELVKVRKEENAEVCIYRKTIA